MTEIVVVVPVLGRPDSAAPLAESWEAARRVPQRLLFVCSPSDTWQIAACRATGEDYLVATWEPGSGDFARKVNLAYRESAEPWLFQAADDVRFEPGWDDAALACAAETGAQVVGTDDGANPSVRRGLHSTHSLIARSYVDDPGASMDGSGSVFSEAYDHQMCDLELVELAKARGVWTFAHESKVAHQHWLWGTAVKDATYMKGEARARVDQRLYSRRRRLWTRGLARSAAR